MLVTSLFVPSYDQGHNQSLSQTSPYGEPTIEGSSVQNPGDVEKSLKGRHSDKISPELRSWPDDIVSFDSKNDPQNPKNWSSRKKVFVTMLFGMTTMCSTFASSVYSPGIKYIARDFDTSSQVATLGISLYILGFIPGPIIFGPLSEMYGRKPSVLVPMFIFICFSAATAVAKDLQTIFITRFFAGVMASSPITSIGGGLADMYEQKERGTAVVFYSLAVIAGPCLGPIIGGAVSQSQLGWRWTEYLSVVLTSVIITLDIICLPETYAPAILTHKARRLRLKTGRWSLHSRLEMNDFTITAFLEKNLRRPLRMIIHEPVVFALTLYNSFAYGILYLLFAAVPIIYEQHRGYNTLVGSLPFLGVMLGTFIAAAINIWYSQVVFAPLSVKHEGQVDPEKRLPPMMIGSIAFPVGFFLLGWTYNPSIHWFPSVLGLVFIGMSFLLIFQASFDGYITLICEAGLNYLIDAYTKYSASAVAANTFMRSFVAAALPLLAKPLFKTLGINWACTLLGGVSVLLAGVPFLFYVYGKKKLHLDGWLLLVTSALKLGPVCTMEYYGIDLQDSISSLVVGVTPRAVTASETGRIRCILG
ncbi:major facilitator superfamily domain-containing protein [Gautieria morchelliformis]|nr:major facilitator superfamily domain-containing protein [Gautieria morchelliformis]